MAIRLVFVAGIVAFAAAFAAWAFGGLTPLQAVMFYIASGWVIILGGTVGYLITNGVHEEDARPRRNPRSIVVHVTASPGR